MLLSQRYSLKVVWLVKELSSPSKVWKYILDRSKEIYNTFKHRIRNYKTPKGLLLTLKRRLEVIEITI